MSSKITSRHLSAYLAYMEKRQDKNLPAPYNDHTKFSKLSEKEVEKTLQDLYKSLKLPDQRAWAMEDRFLKEHIGALDILPVETPQEHVLHDDYTPVSLAINSANCKAYIHWLADSLGKPLENYISGLAGLADNDLRKAIIKMYAQAGIKALVAKKSEELFANEYKQSTKNSPTTAPVTEQDPAKTTKKKDVNDHISSKIEDKKKEQQAHSPQAATQSKPLAPILASPSITKEVEAVNVVGTLSKKPQSFSGGSKMVGRILFLSVIMILATSIWVWNSYKTYTSLQYIYPLTDRIVVRPSATDDGSPIGSMHMFGSLTSTQNLPSAEKYKLADTKLYNGFYKVLRKESFSSYLLGGANNEAYVYARFVTTSIQDYEHLCQIIESLRYDVTERDKLSFAARQILLNGLAGWGASPKFTIAPPCDTFHADGKNATYSVFKYLRRSSDELIVIFQANNNICYYLKGNLDGTISSSPDAVAVAGEQQLPAGGAFTFANGICRYKLCSDTSVFIAKYPFTTFSRSDR